MGFLLWLGGESMLPDFDGLGKIMNKG